MARRAIREQAFALEQAQHPGSGGGLTGGDVAVAVAQHAGAMVAKRGVRGLTEYTVDGTHMDMGAGVERSGLHCVASGLK